MHYPSNFNSDDNKNNVQKFTLVHSYEDELCGIFRCTDVFYSIWKTTMINEFHVASKVSVCIGDSKNECTGDTDYLNLNLKNNWTCSEYLNEADTKWNVEIVSTSEELVTPEYNKNATLKYKLTQPKKKNAPECACKSWLVTVKGQNGYEFYKTDITCGSTDITVSLPPNSGTNTYYTINAQLFSTRK